MLSTASSVAAPKRRIGRYRVTGRIGRGGMGMVYRGFDEVLEREVAIKTLTGEGLLDEESRKRFEIEAKAAAKLQHPNILTVFELGQDRGMPFIAMELLPGVDLELLLRSGEPFLLQEKLDIVIQVLRGLAFAHEHGIVHRDIKPSNIRILDDGGVKIMDFGIAKLGSTSVTKSGMMVGTVHYMSPEQIRGQALDGRSDVFSVGVILHELLSGQRPFAGEGPTEVLYKIVHVPAPPLPLPGLGPFGTRLEEIVKRALEKLPEQRFAGASGMADALAEALGGYSRSLETTLPPREVELLGLARRLLKEGRIEDGERRLRALVDQSPHSVEARRALRTASRELQRQRRPAEPEADAFPELDSTFQAGPTQRAGETEPQGAGPEATREEPPASPRSARGLVAGLLAGAVLAVLAGLYLLAGHGGQAAPASQRVRVRSRPVGASILVDGKETGLQTDGDLELPGSGRVVLTLRKQGYHDAARSLALPLEPGEAVLLELAALQAPLSVISDPPGASVSLDGRRVEGVTPQTLSLDPGSNHRLAISLEGHERREIALAPGAWPAELRVALEPAGPLGSVAISSSYPIEVTWRGRVLARDQASPHVSLPAGRQSLGLLAPGVYMRTTLDVNVRGGAETAVAAPGLGKLNVRANPDNCRVFIDGSFADYPPIMGRTVAAGAHSVSFRWSDGAQREERVQVEQGGVAFVTGRRD